MKKILKSKVANGIYWVEIPEADLRIQCGSPGDTVKHLIKSGKINRKDINGVFTETGPNVILLSELSLQKGNLSNLTEFSILQMLYRQGLIIPGHPNNTGARPILIGTVDQITSQLHYIHRGNYGLLTKSEIVAAGIEESVAGDMMRLKLKFAFGNISDPESFFDSVIIPKTKIDLLFVDDPFNTDTENIKSGKQQIRNNVFVRRLGVNQYEFQYKDEAVAVDLNLKNGDFYEAPYNLDFHDIKKHYFSIVHSGDGDGWNMNQPCMASVLIFKGKIYLVDAGPSLFYNLKALGISLCDVEGIFHTHVHDDHFASLPLFMSSDKKIKYFSSPMVRNSVIKKFGSLLKMNKKMFYDIFDVVDLKLEEWNFIEGLEVMPVFSPHPVDTNIFYFRTLYEGEYKSYAHLADIISFKTLKNMVTESKEEPGLSISFYNQVINSYLRYADIKKIDIGGGMIHGDAMDFVKDPSGKLCFSHLSRKVTPEEEKIGKQPEFGSSDILIDGDHKKFSIKQAYRFLRAHLPDCRESDIEDLLKNDLITFSPGDKLFIENEQLENVFLTLSGIIEKTQAGTSQENELFSGTFVGESVLITPLHTPSTYQAVTYVTALQIPVPQYSKIIETNQFLESLKLRENTLIFLRSLFLFNENISSYVLDKIFNASCNVNLKRDQILNTINTPMLNVVKQGKVHRVIGDKIYKIIEEGGFWGLENVVHKPPEQIETRAIEDTEILQIPGDLIKSVPIISWKLFG